MIDLSRLPAPRIIEELSHTTLYEEFTARFIAYWETLRAADPTLPAYNAQSLNATPGATLGQAWAYEHMLLRARINDAIRAVLAPLATGADLDNVAARQGVERLVLTPATGDAAAVMETDERLLRRYLASFERAAAGSAAAYEYWTLTAWPECHDVAVIGRAVHGRAGDVDLVLLGPGGRAPVTAEILSVRAAILNGSRSPEAVSVTVRAADRRLYAVALTLEIPSGPDLALVVAEAESRVRALAADRMRIGAQVPADAVAGAAYGPSVDRVRRLEPTEDIAGAPYAAPVLDTVTITAEQAS